MEVTKKRSTRRERSRSRGKSPSAKPRRVAKSPCVDDGEQPQQQDASGDKQVDGADVTTMAANNNSNG